MESYFSQIYIKHQKKILFYISQYINDPTVTNDLTQDTFLALWNYRNNIDKSKDILPYLYTIAKNKTINYLRKESFQIQNKVSLSAKEIYLSLYSLEDETFTKVASKDIENKLNNIIDKLPEKQKEVFYLSRYKDMDYKSIAKKCNISVKTVEYRISQVLKTIRIEAQKFIPIFTTLFLG